MICSCTSHILAEVVAGWWRADKLEGTRQLQGHHTGGHSCRDLISQTTALLEKHSWNRLKPSSWSHLGAGALPDTDNPVLVRVEHLAHLRAQHTVAYDSKQQVRLVHKHGTEPHTGTTSHWHLLASQLSEVTGC